jgi:4-hydroxy-tetrahydrodipicolinate synthase
MSKRIHGVLAPVVTPFKADLAPDPERFVKHCQWLLSQNCGLAPFGTTSEGNSMSKDERMSLLDALVAADIDPSRVMPGAGCCSITETVELTAHAVRHGCAGVLMLPPFYYKDVTEEGLYRYFSEVVQRVGDARLRIYLYHIPPVAVVGITPNLVERLLKAYPSATAGMKDSSGDWDNTKTFLDAFAGESCQSGSDFDVFVGSETFLLANMRNGGAGTISATANVNPAAINALYQSAKSQAPNPKHQGNSKHQKSKSPLRQPRMLSGLQHGHENQSNVEMERQQADPDVVREVFSSRKFPSMIATIKGAIAIYADDPAWLRVRPPLVELTTAQAKLLADELKRIGFAMNRTTKEED